MDMDEPSLEAIANLMQGGQMNAGWEGIMNTGQALGKNNRTNRDEIARQSALFKDTFSTESGKAVLEILMDMTIRQPTFPIDNQLPLDVLTSLGIYREGQNQLVWEILRVVTQELEQPDDERNQS